ncbi:MAG: hypothetical protein QXJ06_00860, partial [Candidatus Aenigmatarchaeota archaeon]
MASDDETLSGQPSGEVSSSEDRTKQDLNSPSQNPDPNKDVNATLQNIIKEANTILNNYINGNNSGNSQDEASAVISEIRQLIKQRVQAFNSTSREKKLSFSLLYYDYLLNLKKNLIQTMRQGNLDNEEKQKVENLDTQVTAELERMPFIILAELVSEVYNAKTEEERKEKTLVLQNFLKAAPNIDELFLLLKQIKEGVQDNREENEKDNKKETIRIRSEFFRVLREIFGIEYNTQNAKASLSDAIEFIMPLVEEEYKHRIDKLLRHTERQKDLRSKVALVSNMGSLKLSYIRFFDSVGTTGISLESNIKEFSYSYFSKNSSVTISPTQAGINFITPLGDSSLTFPLSGSHKGLNLFLGPLAVTPKGIMLDPYMVVTRGLELYKRHQAYKAQKSQLEKELIEFFSKNFLDSDSSPFLIINAAVLSVAYLDLDPVTSADIPLVGELIGGKQKSGRVWYYIEEFQKIYEQLNNSKNSNLSEIKLFVGKTFGEKGCITLNLDEITKQIEQALGEQQNLSTEQKNHIRNNIIFKAKLFVFGQLAAALFDEKTFGGYRDMLRGNLGQGSAIETLNDMIKDLMGLQERIQLFYYNNQTKKLDVNHDALTQLVNSANDDNKKRVLDLLLMLMGQSSFAHLRDIAEYLEAQIELKKMPKLDENAVILQVSRKEIDQIENLTKDIIRKKKTLMDSKADLINLFEKFRIQSIDELKGLLLALNAHLLKINYYINKYGKNLARENKEEFENLKLRRDFYSKVIDLLRELLKLVQNNPNLIVNLQEIFLDVNKNLQNQQQQNQQNVLENTFTKDLWFLYSYSISRGSQHSRDLHSRFQDQASIPQRTASTDTQVSSGTGQSQQNPMQPQQP